jgi:energy-coupling factor transport system ATP-binding protein
MLESEKLSVSAAGRRLLEDVSVRLDRGEFVLVRGPSGAGKTTLARCLAGFIPHAVRLEMKGRVLVEGRPTMEMSLAEIASRVGMVLQRPEAQLFNLFVADEIAFAPRNAGLPQAEISRRVSEVAGALGIEHLLSRRVTELSGGEKQRVALASVLAMRPGLLVLDEPLSQLDAQGAASLADALRRLHEAGTGVVAIEQRPGPLMESASRELRIEAGRLVADGAPRTHEDPHERGAEQWQALLGPAREAPGGEEIARLENASVRRDGRWILREVSLALRAGESVALVGPNASGKSTIAGLLAGIIRPTAGRVHLAPKLRVALVPQDPSWMLLADSVRQELEIGARRDADSAPHADRLLSDLGLAGLAERPPALLSVGEMGRLALAAALAARPDLLIVDEPAAGQHAQARNAMMSLAAQRCKHGAALLFITHDIELVRTWADRVVVLREGEIAAEGAPVPCKEESPVEHA